MKLSMNILKGNPKQKINNEKLTLKDFTKKLDEEVKEVKEAIENYNNNPNFYALIEVVNESFDVMQVLFGMMYKTHLIAKKEYGKQEILLFGNTHHRVKLFERGWECKKEIEIDIKEL